MYSFCSAHHTLVPIHCRVIKDVDDFDGAWTVSHSPQGQSVITLTSFSQMWESRLYSISVLSPQLILDFPQLD